MRQKAELPSPQNSTQTQTPRESKFALLSSLTSSHCVKLWALDAHWQAVRHDGSGGHRKACGERLAPTLREEGDDCGNSHGQTYMENTVRLKAVST